MKTESLSLKRKIWFYFCMVTGKTALMHCDMIFPSDSPSVSQLICNIPVCVNEIISTNEGRGENTVFQNILIRINVVLK